MMNMMTTTMTAVAAVGEGEECDDWQQLSKSDSYSDNWLNDDSSDDN